MATAFSIDFPRIVAVELTGSARKPRVKRAVVADLVEPRNEDGTPVADRQGHLNEQVVRFMKENKLGHGKQYLLVGPDAMRYRELRLAFSDKRQINRVLQFQVEGLIPNIPIDDLSIGYIELHRDGDSTLLLVHAAERTYIRSRLTALEAAGCSIEAADSHLSGTIALGSLHPELAADKPPLLWLDFAGTTAAVLIVDKGKVQTARVFVSPYLAGASGQTAAAATAKDAADKARKEAEVRARQFAAETGSTLPAADSVKLPSGESANMGAEQVADRIRHMSRDDLEKFIKRVAAEARRTLAISQSDAECERLVVSGLGDEGAEIAGLLADELKYTQNVSINLMDAVRHEGLPDIGEVTYLTGVALKGLGHDVTHIDFRTGDLAAGTMMDYARTPLAFTATLALLLGGIMFLVSFMHVRRYEGDIAALRDSDLKGTFQRAFVAVDKEAAKRDPKQVQGERTYVEYPDDPVAEIQSNYAKLVAHQKRLQGAVTDKYERPAPADQVLLAVLNAIHEAKPSYEFALMRLTISNNNLNVVVMASVSETAEDRAKLGVTQPEFDRLLASFRRMVAANRKLFAADPDTNPSGRAQDGPDGRKADQWTFSIPLTKVPREAAPKAGASKTGSKTGATP